MFRASVFDERLPAPTFPPISSADIARPEIILPQDGKFRSRTVVSRSRARGTGKYPSWKMGRMIQWESPNELNALRLLDADPAVKAFHEQPLAVRFPLDGATHLHYPDLLVEWSDGSCELWEIKPVREARRAENVARTRYLKSALPLAGFAYRMIVAEELKREPRLSNALTLLKYGRGPVGDADRERIRQLFLVTPVIRWASATNGELGPRGRAILCRLVLEGSLSFDRDRQLAATTAFTSTASGECSI